MSGLAILIPCALGLGVLALAAFYWSLRSGQFDDIEGAGQRVLLDFPGPVARPAKGDGEAGAVQPHQAQ
jgi:cbb3-type cytochrome oxidase maturation protein